MRWFHRVQQFNLEVYDTHTWEYITKKGLYNFCIWTEPAKHLLKQRSHRGTAVYKEMIQRKWISKSWIQFVEWFQDTRDERYLFRGVRNYSHQTLEKIEKYGTDRQVEREEERHIQSEIKGCDPNLSLWASELQKAWEHARLGESTDVLLCAYNPKYLTRVRGASTGYAWTLRDPQKYDFKDALEAIIRIQLKP